VRAVRLYAGSRTPTSQSRRRWHGFGATPPQELDLDRLQPWELCGFESAAVYERSGRAIKLIAFQEVLDEQHVQKM